MGEEKLWTVRDVSIFLGISEKEVIDLAESGAIPAYKIGGVYLRENRYRNTKNQRGCFYLKPVLKKNMLSGRRLAISSILTIFIS